MKFLLLVTKDAELQDLLEPVLPKDWRVQHRPLAPKALEFLEETRPDLIVADLDLPGTNGLVFLRSVQQRLGTLPPAVLIVPQDLSDTDRARLEVQKVRWILRRPVTPEGAKEVLDSVLAYQIPPSMNLVEALASGYTDAAGRLVKLQGGGHEMGLFMGRGLGHPAPGVHSGLRANGGAGRPRLLGVTPRIPGGPRAERVRVRCLQGAWGTKAAGLSELLREPGARNRVRDRA